MRKHYCSEYRLGEKVWYYDDAEIKSATITRVQISHEYNDNDVPELNVYYQLSESASNDATYLGTFKQEGLFSSKKDLKEYIANL